MTLGVVLRMIVMCLCASALSAMAASLLVRPSGYWWLAPPAAAALGGWAGWRIARWVQRQP